MEERVATCLRAAPVAAHNTEASCSSFPVALRNSSGLTQIFAKLGAAETEIFQPHSSWHFIGIGIGIAIGVGVKAQFGTRAEATFLATTAKPATVLL